MVEELKKGKSCKRIKPAGEIGKPFNSIGYRADYENWGIPSDATAADVVKFERDELGNDNHVSVEDLKKLENYSHRDMVWVAKDRDVAKEYLSEGEPEDSIIEIKFGPGARLVGEDDLGGYLILRNIEKCE